MESFILQSSQGGSQVLRQETELDNNLQTPSSLNCNNPSLFYITVVEGKAEVSFAWISHLYYHCKNMISVSQFEEDCVYF